MDFNYAVLNCPPRHWTLDDQPRHCRAARRAAARGSAEAAQDPRGPSHRPRRGTRPLAHRLIIPGPSCRGVLAGLPHTTYRLPDRAPRQEGPGICARLCKNCVSVLPVSQTRSGGISHLNPTKQRQLQLAQLTKCIEDRAYGS